MKKLSLPVAVLALLAAAPAQAALIETPTVTRSATVSPDAPRSLTLTCPSPAVAVSGAVTSGLRTLRASFPRRDTNGWIFRFASPAGTRNVTALLRCVRLNLPSGLSGVRLEVGSAFKGRIRIEPGATRRIAVSCPAGQFPTGWGIERNEALAVAAAVPSSDGWVFRIENTGASAALVAAHIRCMARTQRASNGMTHRFAWRTRDGRACRREESSLATGVSLDPAAGTLLTGTYPLGERRGRWNVRGSGSVKTMLLCLARNTSFR